VRAVYSGTSGFTRSTSSPGFVEAVAFPPTGYWLLAHNGAVFGRGGASNFGSAYFSPAAGDVVDMASTPNGQGYWVVASGGYVRAFGDAKSYGDPPAIGVHPHDITAIAPTVDGHGYWLTGKDGGMFSFGDARFHGSIPGLHLHVHDVVGMGPPPTGAGTCSSAPTVACSPLARRTFTAPYPASVSTCTTSRPSCPLRPAGATC
jgi:hypothetical protein